MNGSLAYRLGRPDLAQYTALAAMPASAAQPGTATIAVSSPGGQPGLAIPASISLGSASQIAQGKTALLILAGMTLGIIGVSVWTRAYRR